MPVKAREQLAKTLFGVSLETLERYPERALKFARGAGTNGSLRALLEKHGYTTKDHARVAELITASLNTLVPCTTDVFDSEALQAIAFIDSCHQLVFELIAASVQPRFPEQAAFLTRGIQGRAGMSNVIGMRMFLDRRDQMLRHPKRASTRKQDRAAIELLTERGVTPEMIDRLQAAVQTATSTPEVEPQDDAAIAAADEAYVRALGDLRGWYEEWARVARAVLKRRDHLALLGLAQRKSPKTSARRPSAPIE